jgi:major membrane immunogen (membrane-anchored lipoprotein)
MKRIKYFVELFLLIVIVSCDKENESVGHKLKDGIYMGSFSDDSKHLWESFFIKKDSFVEVASGGVMFQKFPDYCLTEGTYKIIDDSIHFKNIMVAQPPNGNIADYENEYLLMGSYYIEVKSDSSIVFSRGTNNGRQKYDLKLQAEKK